MELFGNKADYVVITKSGEVIKDVAIQQRVFLTKEQAADVLADYLQKIDARLRFNYDEDVEVQLKPKILTYQF